MLSVTEYRSPYLLRGYCIGVSIEAGDVHGRVVEAVLVLSAVPDSGRREGGAAVWRGREGYCILLWQSEGREGTVVGGRDLR